MELFCDNTAITFKILMLKVLSSWRRRANKKSPLVHTSFGLPLVLDIPNLMIVGNLFLQNEKKIYKEEKGRPVGLKLRLS